MSAGTKRLVRVTFVHDGVSTRWTQKEKLSVQQFNRLQPSDEGILWARGWNTKEANALRVAVAL